MENRARVGRLILVPALISLAMTLLRLTGELSHWSESWFSTATGGIFPNGWSWLVGITWLPVPFGMYFAWKLLQWGQGPPHSAARSFALAVGGVGVLLLGTTYRAPLSFPLILIPIWGAMLTGTLLAFAGWPSLGRVLIAYGFAARVPVAAIMFLAMWGRWGTHYDYAGMPPEFHMEFWRGFFWLAFFPQLIFWVGYTVLVGVLSGSLALLVPFQLDPPRKDFLLGGRVLKHESHRLRRG